MSSKGNTCRTASLVLIFLAVCSSLVTLGGLAAMQATLSDNYLQVLAALAPVPGFSAANTSTMFRFYWFIVVFEIVIACLGLALIADNYMVPKTAITGLFIVATWLTMKASNAWLRGSETDFFQSGTPKERISCTVAGFILTAIMNSGVVATLGWE